MGKGKKRKGLLSLLIVLGAGLALSLFFMLGPLQLLAKSNQPDFCVRCHVMEAQFHAWSHTGAHRRKICVDCHLPNQNKAIHYAWKAIDGMKDVLIFYSGRVPDQIKITAHGKDVLQANCIRCHETTVQMIDHRRPCWECHRRIAHKRSGTISTI